MAISSGRSRTPGSAIVTGWIRQAGADGAAERKSAHEHLYHYLVRNVLGWNTDMTLDSRKPLPGRAGKWLTENKWLSTNDVVQDMFCKLIALPEIDVADRHHFRSLCLRMLYFTVIDHIREKYREERLVQAQAQADRAGSTTTAVGDESFGNMLEELTKAIIGLEEWELNEKGEVPDEQGRTPRAAVLQARFLATLEFHCSDDRVTYRNRSDPKLMTFEEISRLLGWSSTSSASYWLGKAMTWLKDHHPVLHAKLDRPKKQSGRRKTTPADEGLS